MWFLRWYWGLVKNFFSSHRQRNQKHLWEKGFWYDFAVEFLDLIKFIAVTVCLIIAANFLWVSLPEPARVFLANAIVGIWAYTVVLAKTIWSMLDPIKPFFVWLGGLDWLGGMDKVLSIILHIWLGMFATMLAMAVFMLVLDFLKLVLTGKAFKEDGKLLALVSIIPAIVFGYYAATSSYAEAFVNWFTK